MYVRKPTKSGAMWVVIISESISPLSKVIEKMQFTSREAAWQAYRHAMSERV